MNNVDQVHKFFKRKEKRANMIFVLLNLVSFGLAALLVILNLFAIRFNPVKINDSPKDNIVIWMFVIMSIITGVTAVITGVMSFFVFRKRAAKYKDKKESIQNEQAAYKKKEGPYSGKDRDHNLVENVTKIINN